MSILINKQILIILIIFNYFTIFGQEINLRYPKYEKINLNFENNCENDTLEKSYYLKGYNRKYYITNFKNNCNNVKFYCDNEEINASSLKKIKLKKHFFLNITLLPNYLNEDVGNVSFDIYRKGKKVKKVNFFIRNYNYVFSLDKLKKTDTIILNKEKKCLNNTSILFPNIGTTTHMKIYNEQIFIKKSFPIEEKILIDLSNIPKGIYKLYYFADFYKLNKTLIIE